MKQIIFSIIFLTLVGIPAVSAEARISDQGMYGLDNFRAQLDLRNDGTIKIEETIEVNFFSPRHGIFRVIPTKYRTAEKNKAVIVIRDLEVEQNGRPAKFSASQQGNSLEIKIGDPEQEISGRVEYHISYLVERAWLHFKDRDEFYWNITGTDWAGVPRRSSARVTFPEGVKRESIRLRCYTGGLGSILEDCEKSISNELSIERVSAEYRANDFLTIVADFPRGAVTRPSITARIRWFLEENWSAFLPFLALALLFQIWRLFGRDPKRQAIVPEYAPPEEVSHPAEVGALYDGSVDNQDLSSIVIDLAVRGYLRIIEKEVKDLIGTSKSFDLQRTEKDSGDLTDYERILLDAFFGSGKTFDLASAVRHSDKLFSARGRIQDKLYRLMVERSWFARNPRTVRYYFYGLAAVVAVITAVVLFPLVSLATNLALLIIAGLIVFFGSIMPKRTTVGARLYEKILGFKLYLSQAEKYRIQWQEQIGIFEKFLPYAMVFGIADKWTQALAPTALTSDWYVGANNTPFNAYYFGSALKNFSKEMNLVVGAVPKSSAAKGGSGFGGGFSGGGFGGGGGGSW